MADILIYIVLSTFFISLLAFVGLLTLAFRKELLEGALLILVAFSAGALMGGAFLHLLPESIEKGEGVTVFLWVLLGFLIFLILENILYWQRCYKRECPVHIFTYLSLIGDGIHNFLDGLIVAGAYLANIQLGLVTTLIVAFHELPQEIGDFGILVYGGFSRWRALLFNFFTALLAIFGGILGFFLSFLIEGMTVFLLPFAAGGFIYIAASDLIPEFKIGGTVKSSITYLAAFLVGIIIMLGIKLLF